MQNDNTIDNTRPAGPGAVEQSTVDVRPLLEGASEYEYVEILNPLPVDFVAMFGVSRPVRGELRIVTNQHTPTVTNDESDIRRNYGLDLRNKDFQGRQNIVQRVTIPAGHTIRVLGNEAQVIVTQLVNEILQRRKKNLQLADPTQRNIVEQEVVRRRDSVESILGRNLSTVQEQLHEAIKTPTTLENPPVTEVNNEEFSDQRSSEANSGSTDSTGTINVGKRSVGRPAKAKTAA